MTTHTTAGGRLIETLEVAPVAKTSANAIAVVTGSEIDARPWTSVAYTVSIATQSVDWSVWGANLSTYADEVAVLSAATVVAGAVSSYAVAQAPYAYYRVKIASSAGGVHGVATVNGIAK